MNTQPRRWGKRVWEGTCYAADHFTTGKWHLLTSIGAFIALGIAFFLFAVYPGVLNAWFDLNLDLVRKVGEIPRYGEHLEAFLRFFNAEKVFVLLEIGLPIRIISWIRRRFRIKPRGAP